MTRRLYGFGFAAWAILVLFPSTPVRGVNPAQPIIIERWDFNEEGNPEGWTAGPNVTELSVQDGRLRFRTRTNDPYIFAPPVEAPLDGCVVRVAVRCAQASNTQVYWSTPDYPDYGEEQVMTLHTAGQADGFRVLVFPIGKPSDAGRRLTGFRVDPCGGPVGEVGEIDFVELVRVPPLFETTLSFDRHRTTVHQSIALSLKSRQIAGWQDKLEYDVRLADRSPVKAAATKAFRSAQTELRFDAAGVHQVQATVGQGGDSVLYDLRSSIVVEGEDLPVVPGIRTGKLKLEFIKVAESDDVAGARFSFRTRESQWRVAGWLLPLARITVRTQDGRILQREPRFGVHSSSAGWVRLEGTIPDLSEWHVRVDFRPVTAGSVETIGVTAVLTGPPGGQLLEFSAPALRVDSDPSAEPLDRFAVFGGLEMLEPGWPSSSDRAVGEKFAERHTPHPYKVTVPIMSVEVSGLTTSLMWHPLEQWDGKHDLPTATFASPNLLDGQPNHLMRLWVPGIPDWGSENQLYAGRPYEMSPAQPLTLRYRLHAEEDLPAMLATRRWFEVFGSPEPPPERHADRQLYDLIAHSYGQTLYWPEQGGWTQHWFFSQPPAYHPQMAAFLLAHAAETGRREWVERTGIADRTVIDAAGTLASQWDKGEAHARAVAASMRPDGTWPYRNTDRVRKLTREFTNGQHDSLGQDGTTELGVCASQALVILRQARFSGNAELIEAGLKALEGMRQFRVPRGAQVWEVHLEIPDIRAAALAVESFQIGYQLTGDPQYLEDAAYWAATGLPFIYAWHVPAERRSGSFVGARDRNATGRESIPLAEVYRSESPQVTPYGTVPVLGPTFYVVNWFGVLVQWCGLEWAQKVIELDADRPDSLLRQVADGVVLSGLQQMMDREPWTGLYPDAWLLEQNIAQPALIYPGLILACRQAQGRLPSWSKPWYRVLRDQAGQQWHLSGWGEPVELGDPGAADWSAAVTFLTGQPNELVLAGVDKPPDRVVVSGGGQEELNRRQTLDQPGWTFDPAKRAIFIRFVHVERTARVQIDW